MTGTGPPENWLIRTIKNTPEQETGNDCGMDDKEHTQTRNWERLWNMYVPECSLRSRGYHTLIFSGSRPFLQESHDDGDSDREVDKTSAESEMNAARSLIILEHTMKVHKINAFSAMTIH